MRNNEIFAHLLTFLVTFVVEFINTTQWKQKPQLKPNFKCVRFFDKEG